MASAGRLTLRKALRDYCLVGVGVPFAVFSYKAFKKKPNRIKDVALNVSAISLCCCGAGALYGKLKGTAVKQASFSALGSSLALSTSYFCAKEILQQGIVHADTSKLSSVRLSCAAGILGGAVVYSFSWYGFSVLLVNSVTFGVIVTAGQVVYDTMNSYRRRFILTKYYPELLELELAASKLQTREPIDDLKHGLRSWDYEEIVNFKLYRVRLNCRIMELQARLDLLAEEQDKIQEQLKQDS